MENRLNRPSQRKQSSVFIKNTQKNVIVSYFIKLFEYWGNLQSFIRQKKKKSSTEKIMRLIIDEVIMSDGQMYSFLQLFLRMKKLGLDSM